MDPKEVVEMSNTKDGQPAQKMESQPTSKFAAGSSETQQNKGNVVPSRKEFKAESSEQHRKEPTQTSPGSGVPWHQNPSRWDYKESQGKGREVSSARERKRAKKMKNQPTNITFSLSDLSAGPSETQLHRGSGPFRRQEFKAESTELHRKGSHGKPSSGPADSREQNLYRGGFREKQGTGRAQKGGHPSKSQEIPQYITATTFAHARASEVNAMLRAVKQMSSSAQVFQYLPRHMRRRAMSHNVKRLPRRLQAMAKRELEKGAHQKKEKSKSKCRKARRRHGNLLLDFNRRQRKNIWLETHIWHAKRFHMVKKWRYCLGDRPTAKSYRACYRAMTKHCLLQDLSYYCCLEVIGVEEELLKALARLTSKDAGATFAAAACLSGKRQGSLVLYGVDRYPQEALGSVDFIWKPKNVHDGSTESRQLWIWTHPALKEDVLAELKKVCQCLVPVEPSVPVPEPASVHCEGEVKAEKLVCTGKRKRGDEAGELAVPVKKILGDGTRDPLHPVSWKSQVGIVINDLTMEIIRYRLTGPLSHCILSEALEVATVHKDTKDADRGAHTWWSEHCKDSDHVSLHNSQRNTFQLLKGLGSPAEIPAGTVLGLTVGDPRLRLPKKRTKAMPDPTQFQGNHKVRQLTLEGVAVECAQSLIWSQTIRNSVTQNKLSEQELNRLKSELLVPGTRLNLGPQESKIPILLLQQPGKVKGEERPGWGSGWDVLIPKGWGMAFWIPFIYRGARAGGLQEALKHSQYKGTPHSPHDFPDCPAGIQFAREMESELLDKFNRRPPAKRPNYIKHGTLAPFRCPWEQLAEDWERRSKGGGDGSGVVACGSLDSGQLGPFSSLEEVQEERMETSAGDTPMTESGKGQINSEQNQATKSTVCVLRSRTQLKLLSAWCRPASGKSQKAGQNTRRVQKDITADTVAAMLSSFPKSLVWIKVCLLKKGSPKLHSMVYIPTSEDLQQLSKDSAYFGPQEPKHRDAFKRKVKEQKRGKKSSENTKGTTAPLSTDAAGQNKTSLVLGLWPEPLPNVTLHCSRTLIGFVTQGDFSLAAGCGEALGFVSLTGLLHMLSNQPAMKRGIVLIRNPASLQYRFAKLIIEV
ncbi:ribonucleases P/MRP protein subunit POP1 [Latimeria chalumnae]|uniref:ribonucleases P/MRP protein subunit POP1 n=1 Tax=Latimeria chalumnae TaxID=7897 RepID=UPI00313F1B6D